MCRVHHDNSSLKSILGDEDTKGRGVMADKIKDWIEQLVTIPRVFKHTKGRGFKHKIPDDVSFVYCQLEACVIGKTNVPHAVH